MNAPIVLGTVQLGTAYGIANRTGRPDTDTALDILRAAADGGVVALDTAPGYGDVESLIGGSGVTLPVLTKVEPGMDPVASAERSCARLAREQLDGLFFHDPGILDHDPDGPVGRAADLVGATVGVLGVSVYTPDQFAAVLDDGRFGAIQAPFSAADRRLADAGLLERAARGSVAVYLRSAYLQGALLLDEGDLPGHVQSVAPVIEVAQEIARARGCSRSAVLLAYAAAQPGVAGVVVGAETVEQVRSNVGALASVALDDGERARIDALATPDAGALDPRTWPPAG